MAAGMETARAEAEMVAAEKADAMRLMEAAIAEAPTMVPDGRAAQYLAPAGLTAISDEASATSAKVFRNQERLMADIDLIGTGAGARDPPDALEMVADADGPDTVLVHNQELLRAAIMAILLGELSIPAASFKTHMLEVGKAAANQKVLHDNLRALAGEEVAQDILHAPLTVNKVLMTPTATITRNQEKMLAAIRAKNPSAFVKVQQPDQGCCCAVQ